MAVREENTTDVFGLVPDDADRHGLFRFLREKGGIGPQERNGVSDTIGFIPARRVIRAFLMKCPILEYELGLIIFVPAGRYVACEDRAFAI
ncbi:hypothetical protein AA21291_0901 [Swaminathania salitolerans LMG 21291]|uniref:Uncharacterized protein n=1 Tax=Swaminathania salitolerans TaxID=182838 RepID=A0A511BQE7_9PROT|nr:hypothetical protein AA21291_0901 [Swaminathania salitolerans LMG 21291]GEL02561.1 hypothetical protein SSA02_17240 [Swaminathania salitolerans]